MREMEIDAMTATTRGAPASLEKRAAALEIVVRRKADMPESFVAEFTEHASWSLISRPQRRSA